MISLEKLNPCPKCGSNKRNIHLFCFKARIYCRDCGFSSKTFSCERKVKKAAENWQELSNEFT